MLIGRPHEFDRLTKLQKRLFFTHKNHLESILYKEEDKMHIFNCIYKINSKNPYFNRETWKGSKYQREEKMIFLVLLQEWSIKFYLLELQASWTTDQTERFMIKLRLHVNVSLK